MASWNWGGIAFLVVMVLYFPICGLLGLWIEQAGKRRLKQVRVVPTGNRAE